MTRIAVVGAGGRMGRSLVQAVNEAEGLSLGAATERTGSPLVGRDAGELAGTEPLGVQVVDDLASVTNRSESCLPKMNRAQANSYYEGWQRAVARVL